MTDLLSMSLEELQAHVKALGQPAFRAKQLYDWLNRGAGFDEMTNLSKDFRELLKASCTANCARIERSVKSKTDGTEKFLFRLSDANLVEGVLMRYHHGATLCLSTQVGCRMGCAFCASTLGGLVRNCTAGEMIGMTAAAKRLSEQDGEARGVSNIVLMGSGEPLDNYEQTVKFIRLVNDPAGMNIGLRHISLSTAGLVDQLRRFMAEDLGVTLCVSLHAADDRVRGSIMPIAKRWPLQELMAACREYIQITGRRVIFEYALIKDVNDTPMQASALASLLWGMQAHVNLIALNPVRERGLRGVTHADARAFLEALERRGISATIRRELGRDIEGACGQLRRRVLDETQTGKSEHRHGDADA